MFAFELCAEKSAVKSLEGNSARDRSRKSVPFQEKPANTVRRREFGVQKKFGFNVARIADCVLQPKACGAHGPPLKRLLRAY